MKTVLVALTLITAAGLSTPLPRGHSSLAQPSLALTGVTIIDGSGAPPVPRMTVVIADGRIREIGPDESVLAPAGAKIVDVAGQYLIPGLWDMHAHIGSNNVPALTGLFLANGVTGVRDMGDSMDAINQWRSASDTDGRPCPRIIACGPFVTGPNPANPAISVIVTNEAEARRAVADLKERGADFIKVYNSLSRESFLAVADEAKKSRIPFAGHVPDSVSAAEASDAGIASIEHLTGILIACSSNETELRGQRAASLSGKYGNKSFPSFLRAHARQTVDTYSEKKAAALFSRFVKNQTWQVPTLTVLRAVNILDDCFFTVDPWLKFKSPGSRKDPPAGETAAIKKVFQKNLEIVGAMHRAGVLIMAGTDIPYSFTGFGIHDELSLLVQAGLSPMEAIQAATIQPARFLGLGAVLGTIEAGKKADLLLLQADPLEDITNSRKIVGVVAAGRYLSKTDLSALRARGEAELRRN